MLLHSLTSASSTLWTTASGSEVSDHPSCSAAAPAPALGPSKPGSVTVTGGCCRGAGGSSGRVEPDSCSILPCPAVPSSRLAVRERPECRAAS